CRAVPRSRIRVPSRVRPPGPLHGPHTGAAMTERDDSTGSRSRSRFVEPAIADYALDHTSGPDAVQLELQRVTVERTGNRAGMQIGDDQAVLLEILARATGARRAVEIGTFTGYSSL